MSGHIKNSVKSIIFLLVVKNKRDGPALFSRPIKKGMVAEALKKRRVSIPLFFLYCYDILHIFISHDSFKQWFFWKLFFWYGLGLNQIVSIPVDIKKLVFHHFLDDTIPYRVSSFIGGT